ncbi:hypothetical protein OROGR_027775 [Orobanche gracilis]
MGCILCSIKAIMSLKKLVYVESMSLYIESMFLGNSCLDV